ncbi:Uncharacterized protein APZ42_000818 [Daphnia magna]|uniref:Uncharacterized protein n=1 Tax=Daphnia magna TaxID=35525 RepID=A0A164JCU0_9CRUS|nr:Uncharacterized protein APZ42_000818 [Daphnia magna]
MGNKEEAHVGFQHIGYSLAPAATEKVWKMLFWQKNRAFRKKAPNTGINFQYSSGIGELFYS